MSAMNEHPDAKIIDRLGGPAAVARKLGFDTRAGGVQRVQNWKSRGIPGLIRLRRTDVFGPPPADHDHRQEPEPSRRTPAAKGQAAGATGDSVPAVRVA